LLASFQLSDRLLFTMLALLFSSAMFLFQYTLISALSRTEWWQRKRIRNMKQPPAALVSKALVHDFIMQWAVRYALF
jgi:hypothetical protein